jgi:RNA recognition motif-containing protein
VRFRENDVRKLFQENGVTVTTIRLKHDGHKVFAFAETSSEAEIQTAVKALDSKEIHGRRLRVRSSKDKDNKQAQATQEKKRPAPKRELTEDDVTRHLVFAFNGFLDRQGKKEPVDEEKAKKT